MGHGWLRSGWVTTARMEARMTMNGMESNLPLPCCSLPVAGRVELQTGRSLVCCLLRFAWHRHASFAFLHHPHQHLLHRLAASGGCSVVSLSLSQLILSSLLRFHSLSLSVAVVTLRQYNSDTGTLNLHHPLYKTIHPLQQCNKAQQPRHVLQVEVVGGVLLLGGNELPRQ